MAALGLKHWCISRDGSVPEFGMWDLLGHQVESDLEGFLSSGCQGGDKAGRPAPVRLHFFSSCHWPPGPAMMSRKI